VPFLLPLVIEAMFKTGYQIGSDDKVAIEDVLNASFFYTLISQFIAWYADMAGYPTKRYYLLPRG
jgi:hypothetical protein